MDNMYTWWVIKDINEYIILLKGSLWYKIPGFVTFSILTYDAMFVFNFVFNYAYLNIVNRLDMDQISFNLDNQRWEVKLPLKQIWPVMTSILCNKKNNWLNLDVKKDIWFSLYQSKQFYQKQMMKKKQKNVFEKRQSTI